jgi:hypothetical protein
MYNTRFCCKKRYQVYIKPYVNEMVFFFLFFFLNKPYKNCARVLSIKASLSHFLRLYACLSEAIHPLTVTTVEERRRRKKKKNTHTHTQIYTMYGEMERIKEQVSMMTCDLD